MTAPRLPPSSPSPTLDEVCDKAVAYHRAGQLEAAEQLYRAILQAAPKHPAANHFLGLLNVQLQQPEAGLPHLLAALEASPEEADYWLAYIDALLLAEHKDEAQQVLALGRQHGLEGKAVESLATRLQERSPEVPVPKAAPPPIKQAKSAKPISRKRAHPSHEEENALVALFNQERYSEGLALARTMTEHFPQHGFGWKVLGALLRSQGNSADALEPMQKSAQLTPQDAQAQSNLGLVLADLNRLAEAEACHRRALAINPRFADAHNNLGTTLKLQGRLADAEASYRQAIALKPDYAEAQNNLGVTLYEQNRFAEAEVAYRAALAIQPAYAEAYNNLGNAIEKQHRPAEAEIFLRRALQYRPDFPDAHYNLARALRELGRQEEAIDSFRQALTFKPDFAEAYLNLGVALSDLGRFTEAAAAYRAALADRADYADAHYNLGGTLKELGLLSAAESSYRAALAINAEHSEASNNLGVTLKGLGRLPEAEACYRRALTIKQNSPEVYSNLLFNHCFTASHTSHYCREEARQYGLLLEGITGARYSSWSCPPHPSRLRVGLVSGDLRNHPVGYFLESLVAHLDPARIELIAYPTDHRADELSARVAHFFSAWKPLSDYNDEEAARLIHSDGVHILIDASGHTAGNRLPVFAWKPAPIQVSWLGYFASTGVAEIDYLLGDPLVTPEEEEEHFTEKVWRLPETYLCFTAPDIALEIAALPALSAGYVTFGCFNNLSKLNDAVTALWARILHAAPQSRLFLKSKHLNDPGLCTTTRQRFAAHGIAAERLILEGSSPRAELLAAYHRVDIALDPFPYPGGTTSVEALWMGVPVITRRGDRFLSHVGESIAHNAGLSEWIAVDDDDYVAKAIRYSANLERLAGIRAGLRAQALTSPLFDAPRFARNFEAALWTMWQQRQTTQGALQ